MNACPGAKSLVAAHLPIGMRGVGKKLRGFFLAPPRLVTGERQLYSVALDGAGLGTGAPTVHVSGLARSSSGGPGLGSSDGSDELDYDAVSGRLYGTNIATGEMFGYVPGTGPFGQAVGGV